MTSPLNEYRNFLGVYNSCDPTRIPVGRGGTYLAVGENVDIDDEKMIHRRKGSRVLLSGDVHSLWSNDKLCFFCDGGNLKRLYEDYSSEVLLGGLNPRDRMTFVEAGGIIIFSNKAIVGFIEDGTPHPFPNPGMKFKKRMVGGHHLEYFNSRIYAAQNNKIFYSDATDIMRMDTRKNFLPFTGWITMLKAVADGLYVGAGDEVNFLAGSDPLLDGGFLFNKLDHVNRVIEGSAVKCEGEDVGPDTQGTVIYWATEVDVYKGLPGGQIKSAKGAHLTPNAEKGSAVISWDRGYQQYLFVYEFREATGGGELKLEVKPPTINLRGTTS